MTLIFDDLAARLLKRVSKGDAPSNKPQYWVAIAGGPGSGKSTVADAVAERVNKAAGKDCCVVLPMDGFHFTQDQLKEIDPPDAENMLLRRGAPYTIDAELCLEILKQAKEDGHGVLPAYSREISDPVPQGVELLPQHEIVLVEGLYLLLKDDERFAPLLTLWDEKWFVKAPTREIQRERLIERSLSTWSDLKVKTWGEGEEGAKAKVDGNDALNMDRVAPSERYADVVIENT